MNFKSYSPEKWVSPEQAVSKIKGGSRVLIGTGAGEPACLIRAMIGNKNLYDIALYQMLSWTLADYINDEDFLSRFSLKLFFGSSRNRVGKLTG